MTQAQTQGWTAAQATEDRSWTLQLTPLQVAGFKQALEHAQQANKPMLEMTAADFPLPDTCREVLCEAISLTQGRWGFSLTKGFPVHEWTEAQTRLAYWGMGLHMGVARPQNMAGEFLSDVRNAGGEYYGKNGRGYNTNAGLDFHVDSGDVVGLMCRRTAKTGGQSKIVSTRAIYQAVADRFPEVLPTLHEPIYFSWQGAMSVADAPYYPCPVAGFERGYFVFRFNLKNILAAQRDFEEVPRLTEAQKRMIEVLESLFPDPEFCYSMDLEAGDMQLVNNYTVIHSRTAFEDFDEPDRRRHLIRLWLSIANNQPLPEAFAPPLKGIAANTVRGGMRGVNISDEFLIYEQRQARAIGLDARYYQDRPR